MTADDTAAGQELQSSMLLLLLRPALTELETGAFIPVYLWPAFWGHFLLLVLLIVYCY